MIGSTYTSKAVQAVIGPAHSSVIPDVLWSGWLDASLAVLGMTGMTVSHDDFGPITGGVANISDIDAGTAPVGTIAHFAVFDAATSGALVAYASVTFASTPTTGDPLVFAPAALEFEYVAP